MHVKIAFLNGNLVEKAYMTQPDGFTFTYSNKVCKLQISIYGLKQVSRSLNIHFDETVKDFDFSQNLDEPCVYENDSGSTLIIIVLYVDNILLIEKWHFCPII